MASKTEQDNTKREDMNKEQGRAISSFGPAVRRSTRDAVVAQTSFLQHEQSHKANAPRLRARGSPSKRKPCRRWVRVKREPMPNAGFEVLLWIPRSDLTPKEEKELECQRAAALEAERVQLQKQTQQQEEEEEEELVVAAAEATSRDLTKTTKTGSLNDAAGEERTQSRTDPDQRDATTLVGPFATDAEQTSDRTQNTVEHKMDSGAGLQLKFIDDEKGKNSSDAASGEVVASLQVNSKEVPGSDERKKKEAPTNFTEKTDSSIVGDQGVSSNGSFVGDSAGVDPKGNPSETDRTELETVEETTQKEEAPPSNDVDADVSLVEASESGDATRNLGFVGVAEVDRRERPKEEEVGAVAEDMDSCVDASTDEALNPSTQKVVYSSDQPGAEHRPSQTTEATMEVAPISTGEQNESESPAQLPSYGPSNKKRPDAPLVAPEDDGTLPLTKRSKTDDGSSDDAPESSEHLT